MFMDSVLEIRFYKSGNHKVFIRMLEKMHLTMKKRQNPVLRYLSGIDSFCINSSLINKMRLSKLRLLKRHRMHCSVIEKKNMCT